MLDILKRIHRTGMLSEALPVHDGHEVHVQRIHQRLNRVFGRALRIRHVDAGSCNACELEIQALANPYYNLEGTGIAFVASPRHADVLLVTGPVSVNMEEALKRAYEVMPDPKWVIAVGDCGACGGIFGINYASRGRVSNVVPVDATIPGCPPAPLALLHGLLLITRHPRQP